MVYIKGQPVSLCCSGSSMYIKIIVLWLVSWLIQIYISENIELSIQNLNRMILIEIENLYWDKRSSVFSYQCPQFYWCKEMAILVSGKILNIELTENHILWLGESSVHCISNKVMNPTSQQYLSNLSVIL